MTIENLRKLNPEIEIYSTSDKEFCEYGSVINGINTEQIVKVAEKIKLPDEGTRYEASVEDFENLAFKDEVTNICYGELDVQVGYCWGKSSFLNGWEWHTSSEVNVAVTDLVLLLAKRSELSHNKIDSSAAKAFYIKKGEIVEIFGTSLHFCPCQADENGFGCVVVLPKGSNCPLDNESNDPYLFRKNKWIVAHNDNLALIARGVVAGISGKNIEIKYPAK